MSRTGATSRVRGSVPITPAEVAVWRERMPEAFGATAARRLARLAGWAALGFGPIKFFERRGMM